MKKLLLIIFSLVYLSASLPTFAITGDTPIIPYIGSGLESGNTHISKELHLEPIKLPKKIYQFELTEVERALVPSIFKDQFGIWTSPLRMRYRNLKWFIPAAGASTALLILDKPFSRVLTSNNNPNSVEKGISKGFSIAGEVSTLALPGILYLSGIASKNDHLRETGFLQYEALGDAALVTLATKAIFGRKRPEQIDKGEFFKGGNAFPSAHAIGAWTIASVASHEYPDKKWIPIVGYSLASIISASRVTEDEHFVSDVVVGALAGYLIGKYVVRHHSQFNKKKQK